MCARVLAGITAAVAFSASAIASAAGPFVDATNPGQLASIIQDLGYRAAVDVDGIGDPMIRSSAEGIEFVIYFYNCTDNAACKFVLFRAGFDLVNGTTDDVVNEWNANALFGRAYLDDEADPWLEMSVNLDGGVSRANFEDSYHWWTVVLGGFKDHIEF